MNLNYCNYLVCLVDRVVNTEAVNSGTMSYLDCLKRADGHLYCSVQY